MLNRSPNLKPSPPSPPRLRLPRTATALAQDVIDVFKGETPRNERVCHLAQDVALVLAGQPSPHPFVTNVAHIVHAQDQEAAESGLDIGIFIMEVRENSYTVDDDDDDDDDEIEAFELDDDDKPSPEVIDLTAPIMGPAELIDLTLGVTPKRANPQRTDDTPERMIRVIHPAPSADDSTIPGDATDTPSVA